MELFMCSVLKREGYGEAFRWYRTYKKIKLSFVLNNFFFKYFRLSQYL
jgi:hypothetical protein